MFWFQGFYGSGGWWHKFVSFLQGSPLYLVQVCSFLLGLIGDCQASLFTSISPSRRKAFGHMTSPHCWSSNDLKIGRGTHASEIAAERPHTEVRMLSEEVVNFFCETLHTASYSAQLLPRMVSHFQAMPVRHSPAEGSLETPTKANLGARKPGSRVSEPLPVGSFNLLSNSRGSPSCHVWDALK